MWELFCIPFELVGFVAYVWVLFSLMWLVITHTCKSKSFLKHHRSPFLYNSKFDSYVAHSTLSGCEKCVQQTRYTCLGWWNYCCHREAHESNAVGMSISVFILLIYTEHSQLRVLSLPTVSSDGHEPSLLLPTEHSSVLTNPAGFDASSKPMAFWTENYYMQCDS